MRVLLQGRGWWKTADDPWQTLATSMEIADAIRSPDPTQFVSHQPVHQDGSCNGLQHYAALGHDSYGAKQVNLMPADRPQDVYEEVQQYENLFTTATKISQDNHSKFPYKSKIQIDAKN